MFSHFFLLTRSVPTFAGAVVSTVLGAYIKLFTLPKFGGASSLTVGQQVKVLGAILTYVATIVALGWLMDKTFKLLIRVEERRQSRTRERREKIIHVISNKNHFNEVLQMMVKYSPTYLKRLLEEAGAKDCPELMMKAAIAPATPGNGKNYPEQPASVTAKVFDMGQRVAQSAASYISEGQQVVMMERLAAAERERDVLQARIAELASKKKDDGDDDDEEEEEENELCRSHILSDVDVDGLSEEDIRDVTDLSSDEVEIGEEAKKPRSEVDDANDSSVETKEEP